MGINEKTKMQEIIDARCKKYNDCKLNHNKRWHAEKKKHGCIYEDSNCEWREKNVLEAKREGM